MPKKRDTFVLFCFRELGADEDLPIQPDGSEVVLQQEGSASQAVPAQATSTVAAPPAYGQDVKTDNR